MRHTDRSGSPVDLQHVLAVLLTTSAEQWESELVQVESYVEVGKGVRLFVSQGGTPCRASLLVIHGGPDWDHSYLHQPLELLTDQVHLVMPDLRGCGRSTRGLPRELYTPDAVVGDLLALLEALGLPKVAVLGFSYGGLIAQRLTCTAPERVSRLIVASSSVYPVDERAFGDWPARAQARAKEAAVWTEGARGGTELTKAAAVAGAASNVYRPEARADYLDVLTTEVDDAVCGCLASE